MKIEVFWGRKIELLEISQNEYNFVYERKSWNFHSFLRMCYWNNHIRNGKLVQDAVQVQKCRKTFEE